MSDTLSNENNEPKNEPEKKEPSKTDESKKSLNDITQELIKQLKDSPTELFMTIPSQVEEEPPKEETQDSSIIDHIKKFNIKPKEIKKYLDRFIIGQSDAKKALAIAICDHYNFIKEALHKKVPGHYTKQNILMIGPTGVGKTYLIKRIAELIGVPFIKSDATKFTETGYQGGDVEDLVRQLYKKADKNIELAQYGIIYIDEIDKITGSISKQHKDVSGRGVQSNLLKLMEDTEVPTQPSWDIQSQIKQMMGKNKENKKDFILTKNILFIVSGAFNGLDEIIKKRLDGATIGFERSLIKTSAQKILSNLRTQDLIKFGLEPEFSGRLPVRVPLETLNADDLYKILINTEESILEQYIQSFKRFGIEISFDKPALKEIATNAIEENIGARALSTTMEKIFREFKFEYPSTIINFLFIDKSLIQNPEKALKQGLENPSNFLKENIKKEITKQVKSLNIQAPISSKLKTSIYKKVKEINFEFQKNIKKELSISFKNATN